MFYTDSVCKPVAHQRDRAGDRCAAPARRRSARQTAVLTWRVRLPSAHVWKNRRRRNVGRNRVRSGSWRRAGHRRHRQSRGDRAGAALLAQCRFEETRERQRHRCGRRTHIRRRGGHGVRSGRRRHHPDRNHDARGKLRRRAGEDRAV